MSLSGRDFIPNGLMLVLGLILLIPSAGKIYLYYTFRHAAVAVDGTVDKASGGGAGLGGRPLVQYEDRQGNVHVVKSKVKTHFFVAPREGETVKVLFLENDSRTAMVDSVFHHVVVPLVFLVIGAYVIFLAVRNYRWRAKG